MKKLLCCLGLAACFSIQGYSLEESYVEWNVSKPEITSYAQLKDRWTASLLQECIRSSVEKECLDQSVACEVSIEDGLLPCGFSARFAQPVDLEVLSRIKEGKEVDLSEHFNALHNLWSHWVESEKAKGIVEEEYEEFLNQSEQALQEIKIEDLMTLVQKKSSVIALKKPDLLRRPAPKPFAFRNELASNAFHSEMKGWEPSSEGTRGGEPKSEEAKLFFNLPLTDEDKVIIRKIVTSMADKNVLQLLMDKKSMERKGDKIRPVHPMRFIGFVLSDPNLRRCMKLVSKTTFKWGGFLDGYEKRMKEESKAGNLFRYTAGLADLLEVERHVIQRYLNQSDYEGLVKHFL